MCLGFVLYSSVRMDVEEPQIKGALGGPDRHWALPQFLRALREKELSPLVQMPETITNFAQSV